MAAMWRNHQPSAHQAISEELSHVILHIMIDMNGQRQPCRRRVCLFGLSADPPTAAHVEMAHRLSQQDLDFQEIRIMPVYRHQFASKRDRLLPYRERLYMCQLAFEGMPKVVVSECEKTCFELMAKSLAPDSSLETLRVGTFDLLDLLTKEEPDAEFTFCMGADTFIDLTNWKWKQSREVLQLLKGRIVVFQRQVGPSGSGDHVDEELQERVSSVNEEHNAQVQLVRLEINDARGSVSSTKIRSIGSREELKGLVVPQIEEFIVKNQLYGFAGGDSGQLL